MYKQFNRIHLTYRICDILILSHSLSLSLCLLPCCLLFPYHSIFLFFAICLATGREPKRLSKVKGTEEIKMDRAFVITQVFSLRAARTSTFHLLFFHWFKDSWRAWQSIPGIDSILPVVDDEVDEGKKDESTGCPDQVNRVNVRPVNGESN